jgi:hypothetical protein
VGVSAARLPVRDLQRLDGDVELPQGFFYAVGYEEDFPVLRFDHALGYAVIEEGEQFVVEAIDVQQEDRFLVEFEGVPRENFEEFFKRAKASGESDEGVCALSHEGLARVHGVGDVQLSYAMVGYFEINQDFWNDADYFAAG